MSKLRLTTTNIKPNTLSLPSVLPLNEKGTLSF